MSQPPIVPWWPRPETASLSGLGQTRLERIPTRGLASTGALALATLAWITLAGSMVMAALGTYVVVAAIAGAILATITIMLLRAWITGTFVNDAGFLVRRTWSTKTGLWSEVTAIDIGKSRVSITCSHVRIGTHVRRWSLDLLGSEEAYEAAADRLMRWYQQQ